MYICLNASTKWISKYQYSNGTDLIKVETFFKSKEEKKMLKK